MSPGLHPVLSVAPQVLGSARPAAHSVATRIERNPPPRAPWTAQPPLQALLLVAWLYRLTWPTSIAAEAPATAAQTWAAALLGTGWRPGDIRRALVARIQSWASGAEASRRGCEKLSHQTALLGEIAAVLRIAGLPQDPDSAARRHTHCGESQIPFSRPHARDWVPQLQLRAQKRCATCARQTTNSR